MEPEPTANPEESIALDPTPAEVEAWVASERRRREAWLQGPTADEQAAYAQRVRDERLAELQGPDARLADRMRQMKVYPREAQLAAEGAMSLLLKWSRQGFAELVRRRPGVGGRGLRAAPAPGPDRRRAGLERRRSQLATRHGRLIAGHSSNGRRP